MTPAASVCTHFFDFTTCDETTLSRVHLPPWNLAGCSEIRIFFYSDHVRMSHIQLNRLLPAMDLGW